MFHFVATLIGLYVIMRFVPPLPVGTVWKWLIAILIFLIAQYHLINRIFSGSMASPEMPVPVLILAGWLFGALLLLMFFLLLKDIAALVMLAAHKTGLTEATFRPGYRTVLVLALAALTLSAFGVWQAVRIPDIQRVDITLKRLPTALDGFRMVQITDLHASRLFSEPWTRAVVNKVNATHPDLIVMTGDLVDGTPANRASDVAPLADLKARLGVFAVSGNHEYYSGHDGWKQRFTQLGLNFLENTHVRLTDRGQCLILAGLTDPVAPRFNLPAPILTAHFVRPRQTSPSSCWPTSPPVPPPMHGKASISNCPAIHTAARYWDCTSSRKWPTKATSPVCTLSATCNCTSATAPVCGAVFRYESANPPKSRKSCCMPHLHDNRRCRLIFLSPCRSGRHRDRCGISGFIAPHPHPACRASS